MCYITKQSADYQAYSSAVLLHAVLTLCLGHALSKKCQEAVEREEHTRNR